MTLNKELPEQWLNNRVFRFYERHIRNNSQARKPEATQCNPAKLNQPRPNITEPMHRHAAREHVVNEMKQNQTCTTHFYTEKDQKNNKIDVILINRMRHIIMVTERYLRTF